MSLRSAELQASAKLNLFLDVLGKRSDGFHELELIFQRIQLYDQIKIIESDEIETIQIDYNDTDLNFGTADIYYRAVEAVREIYPDLPGIRIQVTKNIPIGGGLGGSSSGAAVILKQLATWYDLSQPAMVEIALALGSDVPFFLSDYVCAYGRGRGELLTALPAIEQRGCYLVNLEDGLETAAVFKQMHEAERGPRDARGYAWWKSGAPELGFNRLCDASRRLLPSLDALFVAAEERSIPLFMSGSGSTCYSFEPAVRDLTGCQVRWVDFATK